MPNTEATTESHAEIFIHIHIVSRVVCGAKEKHDSFSHSHPRRLRVTHDDDDDAEDAQQNVLPHHVEIIEKKFRLRRHIPCHHCHIVVVRKCSNAFWRASVYSVEYYLNVS